MSQIYPNFTKPDSAAGGPAPIQTQRQTHTVTNGEATQGYFTLDFVFPFAFADANYTVLVTLEKEPGADNGQWTFVAYGLTPTDFHVRAYSGVVGTGEVVTIHAVAIHD